MASLLGEIGVRYRCCSICNLKSEIRNRHLVLVLQLIQLPVNPFQLEQFLMSPHLADAAAMENNDPICILNGGQTMRNNARRSLGKKLLQRFPNQYFLIG